MKAIQFTDEADKLDEIKKAFDQNYVANQDTRRRGADDRVFAWVTQWDDTLLADTENAYRGEFNIIRKGTRHIITDLRSNPVQVDFEPKDEQREDAADLLDGLYLTDDRRNSSLESYDNASLEAVDCGLGGWELYTEYESTKSGDNYQVIRRRPIYEANNCSFPDSNAKMLDKSDAMNWGILEAYSAAGYCRLVKDLTGEDREPETINMDSFAQPEQSYVFPWIAGQQQLIYVCRWYERELVTDKVVTMRDPLGNDFPVLESQLFDIMDELVDGGYEIVSEKEIQRWCVYLYIVSGEQILAQYEVAGEHIPVVHLYGERTFIEGEEVWEGAVRLAKDPQRLRNFLLSYLAEIATRSPRPKPMFTPQEVAGHEWMYEKGGADNNYAYYLYNALDHNGNPIDRIREVFPRADLPAGMGELVQETRAAVEDVVNPGIPDEFSDTDLSGYAMEQLIARFDQQSLVYQQNMKHAKRWDAEIYASMAAVVYDSPRRVTVTGRDGQRKQVSIMETILDRQTGRQVVLNDLTNAEFEVFAEIGQTYTSKREKTREHLERMAERAAAVDPALAKILMMQALTITDGVALEGIRKYLRNQLVLAGVQEPETPKEIQLLQQAQQQGEQPSPEMLYAMAEQMKGQADQMDAETNRIKAETDRFRAETDRVDVLADLPKKQGQALVDQAKVRNLQADTMKKITESLRGRAPTTRRPEEVTFPGIPGLSVITAR